MSIRFCPNCAEPWEQGAAFCRKCGLKALLQSRQEAVKTKYRPGRFARFLMFAVIAWLVAKGIYGVYLSLVDTGVIAGETISRDSGERDLFQIRVDGTNNLRFHGSYLIMQKSGESSSRSVSGAVPQRFTASGSMISVTFQKEAEIGQLDVVVERGGVRLKHESTTAPYGVVSIATR